MKLIFSPIRTEARLAVSVAGDVLTLNGVAFDFGPLPRGAILPQEAVKTDWIIGDVTRSEDGSLSVPLLLPHGPDAPPETLFPIPVEAKDGPVMLPPYTSQMPEEANINEH